MNPVCKKNLFQWTLKGKPYWILVSVSLLVLVLTLGAASI